MIQGITFINTLATIGMFLGITLPLFLLIKKSRKNKANLFLGFVILFFMLLILPGYLFGAKLLIHLPHTIRLNALFSFALGPWVYFYVKSCTQEDFKFKKVDSFHFVPVIIGIFPSLSFLTLNGAEKYAIFLEFTKTGTYPVPKLGFIILVTYTGIYTVLSIQKIISYRKHINETSSYIDRTYHRWLLFFIVASIFPIFVLSLHVLFGFEYVSLNFITFSIVLFMISIYLATLFRPSLFHAFPNRVNIQEEKEAATEKAKQKYESSNLQIEEKESLSQQLLTHLETRKPYKQSDLTLRELADQISTRPYYLSQVINEKIKTNFHDFINQYRIEEAKRLLHDPQFEHYTVIAISMEAGFNSKSTFYTAFKKYTGMTPSKFRKLENNFIEF